MWAIPRQNEGYSTVLNGHIIALNEYGWGRRMGALKSVCLSVKIFFKGSMQYLINGLADYIQMVSMKVMIILLDFFFCLKLRKRLFATNFPFRMVAIIKCNKIITNDTMPYKEYNLC